VKLTTHLHLVLMSRVSGAVCLLPHGVALSHKHRDNFTSKDLPYSVGPCHHGMPHPQVADGGDGLQVWRVAANILNKQSRTAGKG
jgi:hypothetical protein